MKIYKYGDFYHAIFLDVNGRNHHRKFRSVQEAKDYISKFHPNTHITLTSV